jgi:hypothetical protein
MDQKNKTSGPQDHVIDLLTVANEYCLFIEKAHEYGKEEIFDYLHKISPLLYLKGTLIPNVDAGEPEIAKRFVTIETWENIFNGLRNVFGKDDEYWYIDEKTFNGEDVVKGSMAEDLSDIYQDLKDFVLLYNKRTHSAILSAISECRQLFYTNWGYKIIRIQKNIHHLLYRHHLDSDFISLNIQDE